MSALEPILLVLQNGDSIPLDAPDSVTTGTTENGAEPAAPGDKPSIIASLFPFLIIGGIFWVLLIAPERKNRKKQEAMRGDLKKGDDVMTTGGMFGKIVATKEDQITLQIADGVRVKFLRQSIQGRVGDEPEDGKKPDSKNSESKKPESKDGEKDPKDQTPEEVKAT